MTPEQLFDAALAQTTLPPRGTHGLAALAETWAPPPLAQAIALAVRMARRGEPVACLMALQDAARQRQEVAGCGCMACGGSSAWHGELCPSCRADGWEEVGCPTCGTWHLQRPDGHILGGCHWARDQNDEPATYDYDAADAADDRQQMLLDLGGR